MKTLILDDDLSMALDAVSGDKGLDSMQLATNVLRRFVELEQQKRRLKSSELEALYQKLADEDTELAEAGMEDYSKILEQADKL